MGDTSGKPESHSDTLDRLLAALKSGDPQAQRAALGELDSLTFSSAAIVAALEQIALNQEELRPLALAALTSPASRAVYRRGASLDAPKREILLGEIAGWQKGGLLDETRASILKGRYGFDFFSAPTPKPAPAPQAAPPPRPEPVSPAPAPILKRLSPTPPVAPASPAPQRTFLQAILSETSIKIFLYLGAFFVVASAAILAALVAAARLPVLGLAALVFGGTALGLRKRLPQPSFALFIVFSFLLPITASVLRQTLSITGQAADLYWLAVLLIMAGIWSFSTWIYESRLFSLTAFGSLTLAFLRVGNLLDAEAELYGVLAGLSALIGLAGVWALKRWKGPKFALGLFLAAQAVQVGALLLTLVVGIVRSVSPDVSANWHFASALAWLLAFGFYALSDILFPTFFFPWLAAATLIPVPWFVNAAMQWEGSSTTWLFLAWGLIPSLASEAVQRVESIRKYSLPSLLASMPSLIIALTLGFNVDALTGFGVALIVAATYTLLHLLREREWLWTLALLYFITAYFAFFSLPFIENTDVFWGYRLLGLSLLSLLPDLFLKADFKDALPWRRPLRLFGALFTGVNILLLALFREDPLGNAAILFGAYAILCAVYAWRYQRPIIGYASTLTLALATLFALQHFDLDLWLPALTSLSVLYYLGTLALRGDESHAGWRRMLTVSALALGSIVSLVALVTFKPHGGWFIAIIGALFIAEMYLSKRDLFEAGAHLFFPAAAFLLLRDFQVTQNFYILLALGLTWLTLDMVFSRTFPGQRDLGYIAKILGFMSILLSTALVLIQGDAAEAAICFGISTVFFLIYAAGQGQAVYGYAPALYLPLTVYFTLQHFDIDAWLPSITGLAVTYFAVGTLLRAKADWGGMLRRSGLIVGAALSLGAFVALKETGGWYILIIGLLFAAEMYLSRNSRFEIGLPILFNLGATLLLRDFEVHETTYFLLTYSLTWLLTDLLAHLTFAQPRLLKIPVRVIGGLFAAGTYGYLLLNSTDAPLPATVSFGMYSLVAVGFILAYRQAWLVYTLTGTLPIFAAYFFRIYGVTQWIHPAAILAAGYYAAGYILRRSGQSPRWDTAWLTSGLGLGVILSAAAVLLGGLDAAIPVAVAATLWAVEAFARRNVWLGFPANALYLLAYFIVLFELKVDEPQFFSMGAALLGLIQHYFLTRATSKTATFVTGMVSQLILLGATYIQMFNTEELVYFAMLFFQGLVVLFYGIVIRSRSLVITPILFVVLGVVTVVYSTLQGISTILIVGCTGIFMILLGTLAVIQRERLMRISERFSDWNA